MTPADPSPSVALARAAVDALNRRDLDGLFALVAPEFEYDLTRTDSPLRGVYGRDEMPGVIEDFLGAWETARYEPHGAVEAGDTVVMPFSTHFAGREGIELEMRATWVWTIRGGAVVRLALFQDHDEALRAAGAG